jgi:hypothetical protein
VQGRCLALRNVLGVRLEGSSHLGGSELLDLLGSTADESAGVKEAVELGENGLEEGSAADTLDQVVVLTLLLNVVGSLVGEDAWEYIRMVTELCEDCSNLRISSWASWRERPLATQAMMMFSLEWRVSIVNIHKQP